MRHPSHPGDLRLNRVGLPVTYQHMKCLHNLQTDGVSKVTILAIPSERTGVAIELSDAGSVLLVSARFDFSEFDAAEDRAQLYLVADFVGATLSAVAERRDWDSDAIRAATVCAGESLLKTRTWPNKPVWNRERTVAGQIEYTVTPDAFAGTIVFTRRDAGEGQKRRLFAMETTELDLALVLGTLRWISPSTITLVSRDKRRSWEASVLA